LAKVNERSAEVGRQIGDAQSAIEELSRGFAPASYVEIAEHVRQAEALAGEVGEVVARAAGAADATVQHYFRAAQLLEDAAKMRGQVLALTTAVAVRLADLKAMAGACRRRIATVHEETRKLAGFIAANDATVREPARGLVGEVMAQQRAIDSIVGEPRPDWPTVVQLLDGLGVDLSAANQQASSDVRNWQELQKALAELNRQTDHVGRQLQESAADRPRANQRFRAAHDALQKTNQANATPWADWELLLRQARAVADDLRQAEAWAHEDIRLAEQAQTALREAENQVARAAGYVSLGISADFSSARSQLEQSRAQLAVQAYEQAIQLADSAERSARAVYDAAVAAAEARERAQDHARRKRAAAVASRMNPAVTIAGSIASPTGMGGMPTFGENASAPAVPAASQPHTDSSSSTWQSGSGQSTW
jgi:hypothetical protein